MKNKIVKAEVVLIERIEKKIFLIRNQKVMLSTHLAGLYEVEVKVLNQAVRRNIDRFPKDFMFQLSKKEFENLKSQIVTSSWGGIRRSLPYAFTEQGVAMLSSVLNSKKAIKVNIQIMRAFVKLREILSTHKELAQKLKELEFKIDSHDQQIQAIFDVINQLITPSDPPKRKMGFTIDE
jgi:phage regulator Rha-like protein